MCLDGVEQDLVLHGAAARDGHRRGAFSRAGVLSTQSWIHSSIQG